MWRKRIPFDSGVPDTAAQRWSADARVIAELGAWENAVYLIDAQSSVRVLRLIDADRQPETVVAAELDFICHLAASGLSVACPIRSASGRLIETVTPTVGRTFLASTFEYLSGAELRAEQCRAAPAAFWRSWGAAVARMHVAAAEFTPAGAMRPRWDQDPLVRRRAEILMHAPPRISEQFTETLNWLSTLESDSATFGLVHADLHGRNFRYNGGEFRVFDFDDACYSWWAYDLAVGLAWAFGPVTQGPARTALAALIEGYHEVRPLTADWEQQVPRFVRLRTILDYSYGLDVLARDLIAASDQRDYRAFLGELAANLEESGAGGQPRCPR